jgi:hypothetical protein
MLTDVVEWSWSPGDVLLTVYDTERKYKDIVFRSPVVLALALALPGSGYVCAM